MLSSRSKKINQKHSLALLSGYLFVFFSFFPSSLIHFIHLICCLGIKFNFDVLDSKYIYLNTYIYIHALIHVSLLSLFSFYFFFIEVGFLWTESKSYTSVNACVFSLSLFLPLSFFLLWSYLQIILSFFFFLSSRLSSVFIWREKKNNNIIWNDCESLFAV